jgi:hypothetical protein
MEGQLRENAAETLATWHEMVASRDPARLGTIAAEGIVFKSPAVFTPYVGREPFCLIISTVLTIFEDFRYHRTFTSPADNSVVLEFETRIGDRTLKGIDMIRFDDDGLMAEFEVMIRPASGLQALAEKMAERIGPKLAASKP